MSTIKIEITASNKEFSNFANELGYQAEVFSHVDENNETHYMPNPESKTDFLLNHLRSMVAKELYKKKVDMIEKEIRDERENDKQAIKEAVMAAVKTSVV